MFSEETPHGESLLSTTEPIFAQMEDVRIYNDISRDSNETVYDDDNLNCPILTDEGIVLKNYLGNMAIISL